MCPRICVSIRAHIQTAPDAFPISGEKDCRRPLNLPVVDQVALYALPPSVAAEILAHASPGVAEYGTAHRAVVRLDRPRGSCTPAQGMSPKATEASKREAHAIRGLHRASRNRTAEYGTVR